MRPERLCFIAQNEATCRFICSQLGRFLGRHLHIESWCLEKSDAAPGSSAFDLYVASSNTTLQKARGRLPRGSQAIVAARTINIEHLDRLLELSPGTEAVVVGTSAETAAQAVDLLRRFGFDYLSLRPYHPGAAAEAPGEAGLAITMGLAHLVPPAVSRVIDIGIRQIDLSTLAEILQRLQLPGEILNEVSFYYASALLQITLKRQKIALLNETLKRNIEVILNSVDESIVATDGQNNLSLVNPAAEKLLGLHHESALGQSASTLLPQVDFASCLRTGQGIVNEIHRINDSYHIVTANPIPSQNGSPDGLVAVFRPVTKVEEMETKVRRELKRKGHLARHTFQDVIGESDVLREAVTLATRFAGTDLNILLQGESGTGKELFAQAIHNHSARKDGPFVALNFAALPEELAESELFGYESGAFTGAKPGGKPGLFETAHQGTIFLDEIGDTSQGVQKKLLRVIEEREVRRIGGNTVTPVNVRIIAASNLDLSALVEQNRFRSDLFYRLCTLPIFVPPLYVRGRDILLLARALAQTYCHCALEMEQPLVEFLVSHRWPGNIRELQNVVRYICSLLGPGEKATIRHLPPYLIRGCAESVPAEAPEPAGQEGRFGILLEELRCRNTLKPALMILREVQRATAMGRGVGRLQLMQRLAPQNGHLSEHRVRFLLRTLVRLGFVDSGVTRQGSRITALGERFLSFASFPREDSAPPPQ